MLEREFGGSESWQALTTRAWREHLAVDPDAPMSTCLFPLILVVASKACIIWSIVLHWRQAP
jgi:hypothetical protein